MPTPTYRPSTAELAMLETLEQTGFILHGDGWFYPSLPTRSLVRISVFGGQYQIWRRPRVDRDGWMLIVTADVEDFDADAFNAWRSTWPLC